jgi:uncharacterized protein (TIGR03118 family)
MWKLRLAVTALLAGAASNLLAAGSNGYTQANLDSDLPGVALNQDPDLVNPWGIVASSTSPFWTSDNGTGLSTLYSGAGTKLGLIVTVPPAAGQPAPSDPTGVVFNGNAASFGGAHFIFDTESGTVASWSSGTTASISATGASGSVYKGLGIVGNQIYAANFGLGRIDVFDSSFHSVSTSGGFTDPNLPAGYSPFNIQNLGGDLFVTYAKSSGGKDETDGAGLGYVDVFDANGNLLRRVASQGALNAPWGLALAPSNFGAFSNDLLVGNFGDGTINAYDPATGTFVGMLDDTSGNPLVIDGLWGLDFGNGAGSGDTGTLYFNAGIGGNGDPVESHGLFGALAPVPEPGTLPIAIAGMAALAGGLVVRRRRLN